MLSFYKVFQLLHQQYGSQQWWPADTPFEVMVGAILTQNTSWSNVEKAIKNLKDHKALCCQTILELKASELAELLKPSGYFNLKAKRLKNFCTWYVQQNALDNKTTHELRSALLSVNGIGPETADDILLYAFQRPVFVIDAYTRRIFSRLGLLDENLDYESMRHAFETKLGRCADKMKLFNEYHALLVKHAKHCCKRKKPSCGDCRLVTHCEYIEQ